MGTSIGGYLSSRFGRRAPCFLAAALFLIDFALVKLLLPDPLPTLPDSTADSTAGTTADTAPGQRSKRETSPTPGSAPAPSPAPKPAPKAPKAPLRLDGFRCAFRGAAGQLLALRLMYGFLVRSAYSLHAMYELERWQLTPERTLTRTLTLTPYS